MGPRTRSFPRLLPVRRRPRLSPAMAPSDELEYLKHLVAQLNDKIHALEAKAKAVVPPRKTPAQQLRTILIGPPGAGSCSFSFCIRARSFSYLGRRLTSY